ncbi:MAG: hypothetical protein HY671_08645 [Chloroflexi bacterium]|nr:hypothetical protein [Chloroflexota bacterium]
MRVALKYCGSCNPQVDLLKIGRRLAEVIARRSDLELSPVSASDIDFIVVLCGCPRACANRDEVKARAKRHLLISDESLGDMDALESTLLAAAQG